MHTILGCHAKFNTSLAGKSIDTFFAATENEKCKKNISYTSFAEVPWNPYENCQNVFTVFISSIENVYIFRSLYIFVVSMHFFFKHPVFIKCLEQLETDRQTLLSDVLIWRNTLLNICAGHGTEILSKRNTIAL